MNIAKLILSAILCVNTLTPASAQHITEGPLSDLIVLAIEEKFDLVRGIKSQQDIKLTSFSEPSSYYEIERRDSKTRELITTEITAEWNTLFIRPDHDHYADQYLTENIGSKRGDYFFGRIEIKRMKDHQIVSVWPILGVSIPGKITTTVTTTAYLPSGGKFVYTETFDNNKKLLPLRRHSQVFDENNNVRSDLLFVRK